MEETTGVIQSEFKELRSKTSNGKMLIKFKKHIIGGYKEKDVEEYIFSLTQQLNRTEDVYKERIDEFTTFIEMLTKEKDKALQQLQDAINDANDCKYEAFSIKEENEKLVNQLKEIETISSELKQKEFDRIQNEEDLARLRDENVQLKQELNDVCLSRDKYAGELVVIKKQLDNAENFLISTLKENNELKESILSIKSSIRQIEMKKSLKLSEFQEKQIYEINQTAQSLKKLFSSLETMKNDVNCIFTELNENKFSENTKE